MWVKRSHIKLFYLFNGFMILFASSNRDLSNNTKILKEKKYCYAPLDYGMVKYFETTINTKFTMANHYLTKCNTNNSL